jgi:hypothetical protein
MSDDSGPTPTKDQLANARTIAKGRRIRDLPRLLAAYGGSPSGWRKVSSPVFEFDGKLYEYHWYEQHGLGRFEVKLKEVG